MKTKTCAEIFGDAVDLVAETDQAPLYLIASLKGICQERERRGDPDRLVARIAEGLDRWHRKHPHNQSCKGIGVDQLKPGWALDTLPEQLGVR